RHDGRLRLEGAGLISSFELMSDELPDRCVIRVSPIGRVMSVKGTTIKVNLSTVLDLWSKKGMRIEQELFFCSDVKGVKVHEEEARDKEAVGGCEGTHYLEPGDAIKSVRVNGEVVTVWVQRSSGP